MHYPNRVRVSPKDGHPPVEFVGRVESSNDHHVVVVDQDDCYWVVDPDQCEKVDSNE